MHDRRLREECSADEPYYNCPSAMQSAYPADVTFHSSSGPRLSSALVLAAWGSSPARRADPPSPTATCSSTTSRTSSRSPTSAARPARRCSCASSGATLDQDDVFDQSRPRPGAAAAAATRPSWRAALRSIGFRVGHGLVRRSRRRARRRQLEAQWQALHADLARRRPVDRLHALRRRAGHHRALPAGPRLRRRDRRGDLPRAGRGARAPTAA